MLRLLVNPAAGRARHAEIAARIVERAGGRVLRPADAGELEDQVRQAVDDGASRLLVAGGDGTLHRAIQVLQDSRCALAIIPTGRGNDLARSLGLELDPARATRRSLEGDPVPIDLGRVGDRVYACSAAVGYDGAVLRFLERRKSRGGAWAYPYAVLRTAFSYDPARLSVEFEGGEFDERALMVVVSNTASFGGGMRIAPQALPDDGWLDLVFIRPLPPPRLLALLPRVYRGRHLGHPSVTTARVRRATIRADRPLTLHGDGEPIATIGADPTAVEVRPGALRVIR